MMHGKADLCDLVQPDRASPRASPLPTFEAWRQRTGLRIIDGIGATEMLHIFISRRGRWHPPAQPAARCRVQAVVVDEAMRPLPPGEIGRLGARPTGCRYLADGRSRNTCGTAGISPATPTVDEEGYFWFRARTDDMIISAGYNIAGRRSREALLEHAGSPSARWLARPIRCAQIVKVRRAASGDHRCGPAAQGAAGVREERIAAYKYPRRSSSWTPCRAPRPARCSASGCARWQSSAPPLRSPSMQILQPPGWPRPRGYANGVAAEAGSCSSPARSVGMRPARSLPTIWAEQLSADAGEHVAGYARAAPGHNTSRA